MAIQVYETPESRSRRGDSFELRLKVDGTTDDVAARWAVLTGTPLIWDGLIRQAPSIEPDDSGISGLWDATVPYDKNDKPREIGDASVSWSTGGGTQRIFQAIATVGKYGPPGEAAPENYGAIGAKPDGTVEGVDVMVPDFRWTERYTVNPGMLTWNYAMTCAYLTRCVNNHGFRGFAAGEVQFRGASAEARLTGTQEQPQLTAEISYEFAAQPNVTNQTIGQIVGIAARGWEHVDVRYEEIDDAVAKKTTPRPIAVYVHQVYPYASFGGLGIGT
jgi:hypothetical protein